MCVLVEFFKKEDLRDYSTRSKSTILEMHTIFQNGDRVYDT